MKNKFLVLFLIVALLFSLSLIACTSQETTTDNGNTDTSSDDNAANAESKTVTNIDGTEITVPTNVQHVGAIFGPSYEKIYMLDAEDKIVCDGDFHINGWPWSNVIYKDLEAVPGIPNAHSELNIEEMLKYDLDVVFNFSNPDTTTALEQAGIAVVPMASTGKFEDLKNTVNLYAEVLGGNAPEIAARYSQYFDEKLKMITDVTSQIPEDEKYRVYFANQEILWTAGNQSDVPEVIELAGGICVHKDVIGWNKTEISKEELLSWDPQYIFVDHAGSSGNATAEEVINTMLDTEEFSGISAVKDDNVYICPTGVFFWDSGVQKILLLMWMAQTMYPDHFPDLDMQQELKTFYSEFFRYDLTDDQAAKIMAHLNP